ncbi:MAG: carboxylesterase family protein [Planctomycetota bacterium]
MNMLNAIPFCLTAFLLLVSAGWAQERPDRGSGTEKSLLQRFDTNGDGEISDDERRGVREKMKQMQNRPGAMTPSGKTEAIGNRLVTELQYPSSDGRMIPCVLSMPKGDGPFPMLVTIHGGQGNRDLGYIRTMAAPGGLSPTINAFNEQPWAILAISYRAGNGALFGMEQDDVVAGIRFAKQLPQIDSNRVGVVGGSHGGHLALVAAEKMGQEFLCVAAGSPWMTDPLVYMLGDPNLPPLSQVPARAREDLMLNGRRLLNGMQKGRRMSDPQIKEFLTQHSIEANASMIVIPTLFLTSRGDDQAPHVLIEPMIKQMQAAKKDIQVYTAEKSPHGFYWARTVSAARDLRGEKTPEEAQEELTARRTMIDFFTQQFARKDAKAAASPASQAASKSSGKSGQKPEGQPSETPATEEAGEAMPQEEGLMQTQEKDQEQQEQPPGEKMQPGRGAGAGAGRGAGMARGQGSPRGGGAGAAMGGGRGGGGFAGADFETLAGGSGKVSRESFQKQLSGSAAFSSRPELADRLFDRLDADGDGSLSKTEFEGMSDLKSQLGRGGQSSGQAGPAGRGANRPGRGASGNPRPDLPAPGGGANPASPTGGGGGGAGQVRAKTSPLKIAAGELVGELAGDVRIFRGVPYAAAPVGERRWQAAGPVEPWQGVREAIQFGPLALQGETFAPRSAQSEDCLCLNIWTPANAAADSKLPVLFWIHGGAFIQGSGGQPRYDGSELAKRGAVVITINYRLGPLGLFAHPSLTAESKPDEPLGNYCLLDMIAALRWTRDNVAAFGGDPGNVTISGSSAGGTSCLFLMGVPQAEGLFHKAIIHSSGGIQNIQTLAEAEAAGVRLAEQLGLGARASSEELRRAAANDLAVNVGLIRQLDLPVKPIIDGRLVEAVPADLFAQGRQAKIPVLIGAANGESGARQLSDEVSSGGAFGFQRQLADQMVRAGQKVWMFQLTYVPPQSRESRFAAKHGESVAYAFGTIGQSLAAQYGFRNEQVANAARMRRGEGGAGGGAGGAARSGGREDDSQPVEDSEQGRAISAAMLEYWITFMRDGQPSGKQLPAWPAHTATAPKTMVFGNHGIAVK